MKRKQLFLAIATLILPISMMAQTYSYFQAENDLWYIYEDGKDKTVKANQMIYVGSVNYGVSGDENFFTSSEFLQDGTIRGNWRTNVLGGTSSTLWWERERDDGKGLDQIESIQYSYGSVMTYAGVEYFPNLLELYIRSDGNGPRDNGGATLDLHQNTKLTSLELKQQNGTATNGYFKYIDVSNTKLTTLNIPGNSADYLETLKLENLSTLTTLTFNGSANFTKLLRLDISQTGITGPLDLSRLTALNRITIDASKAPKSSLTLTGSDWVRKHHDGNIETWVRASEAVHVEIWVDEEPSPNIDLVQYVKMESLKIYGAATNIKMPDFLADDVKLKIDLTDCPNATINWNSQEGDIIKLTLINVASFNATKFTKLKVLRYLEPASANLTLATANDKLKILDITRSGLTSLDLSGGEAPNLTTVKTWYAPLTLLDLSYHTSLLSAPYPTNKKMSPYSNDSDVYVDVDEDGDHYIYASEDDGGVNELDPDKWPGLNIVPTPKSQIDYFAEHAAHKTYENGITDVDDYNENYNNTLKTIKLVGCTSLTDVYLTHGFDAGASAVNADDAWVYYNSITDVDMTDCTGMTSFHCMNTLMTSLKLDGCTNLERIEIDQGKLTGLNGDISTTGCTNLKTLIAKRQKWESLDFFLSADIRDKDDELAKIQQIQVNGGSYTLKTSDDSRTKYVRHDPVTDTDMKYTCRLRHIDLSNLTCWDGSSNTGLRKLLLDCNLLTELDLTVVGPGLQELQCTNNMLTTLDLTPLEASVRAGRLNLNNSNWKYQVGYLGAEIVKGHWDSKTNSWAAFLDEHGNPDPEKESQESGSFDWVALHMVNGGFSHYMDSNFGLYWNLYDARANNDTGQNQIASEGNPWMCKVKEVATIVENNWVGADKFNGDTPCPNGHLENAQHIFLHSQSEIKTDFGAFKDQDLTGCVLTYHYNTGFLQKKGNSIFSNTLNPATNDYSVENYENGTGAGQLNYSELSSYYASGKKTQAQKKTGTTYREYTQDELVGPNGLGHIVVRMHLYPHLLNINPKSKSPMSVKEKQVNYFSSTIYLDYDAKIPAGVTCYTISGVDENHRVFETAGQALDGQLTTVPFGGEDDSPPAGKTKNWILPAYTPVYVRSVSPQPAGLYAFDPIREVDVLGWENLRGENDQDDYILHGIENLNASDVFKEGFTQEALNDAKDRLTGDGKNAGNILEGFIATKYDAEHGVDINHQNYNKVIPNNTLPDNPETEKGICTKRSVLCLGVQNQKSTWPVIGFWPYNGTTLPSNRCYIRASKVYSTTTTAPSSAKGFNFFFVGEEDVVDVTGIKTVNEVVTDENVWYNMQGVRLNAQPTKHGVYIHNGKKVVVR